MTVLYIILGIIGYIACGLWWGIAHWMNFYDGELSYYETERLKFIRFHGLQGQITEVPDFLQYEWRDVVLKNERLKQVPPIIKQYRGEIAFDILFWWLSILSLGVQKLFDIVMRYIMQRYHVISTRRLESIKKDSKDLKIDKELNKKT